MSSTKKMDAFLTKDISQMSYEELEKAARHYGLDEQSKVDLVQIDGLVVLKIIKHCRENLPELVTGQLLGLDVNSTLEVTNSFPFPQREEEASVDEAESGAKYSLEMMRHLREVNVDNNTVGWYTSTYLSSFLSESLIQDQFNYQTTISKCVVVVYDPLKTNQGELSLKAYRLSDAFITLYQNEDFTAASIARAGLSYNTIFEEIPIKISNISLVKAFLAELEDNDFLDRGAEFDRLSDVSSDAFLEKGMRYLIKSIDALDNEQKKFQKFQYYQKNQRQRRGEEEDSRPLPQPPSQLDNLLITGRVNNYCDQINQFVGQGFSKLCMLQGLVQGQGKGKEDETTTTTTKTSA